jgi:hypothetical protein
MLVSPDAIGDHFEWFEVLEKYTKGGTQKIDDTVFTAIQHECRSMGSKWVCISEIEQKNWKIEGIGSWHIHSTVVS